jgi:hypothetical protein
MKGIFPQLMEARLDYYQATPGSREWWDAIRRIRSARRRLHRCLERLAQSLLDAVRPVAEQFARLAETVGEIDISASPD